MEPLEQVDEQFTKIATDDSLRSARIAELIRHRKYALWSVLCVSIVAASLLWLGTGAFWFACVAVSCILFWCQFYQLHSELRALQVVDVFRRAAHDNAA